MDWVRDSVDIGTDRYGLFDEAIPSIRLRTREAAGRVRLGLWAGTHRMAGWLLPHLPADSILTIEGTRAIGYSNGERRVLRNFMRGWDTDFPERVTLPHGTYRLTLDQDPDRAVDVLVSVTMQALGE